MATWKLAQAVPKQVGKACPRKSGDRARPRSSVQDTAGDFAHPTAADGQRRRLRIDFQLAAGHDATRSRHAALAIRRTIRLAVQYR